MWFGAITRKVQHEIIEPCLEMFAKIRENMFAFGLIISATLRSALECAYGRVYRIRRDYTVRGSSGRVQREFPISTDECNACKTSTAVRIQMRHRSDDGNRNGVDGRRSVVILYFA